MSRPPTDERAGILAALPDVVSFLSRHRDVAAVSSVTVSHGYVSVQLSQHAADDDTRAGMLMALAAVYSGDLHRSQVGDSGMDHLVLKLTWHSRRIQIWTALARVGATA